MTRGALLSIALVVAVPSAAIGRETVQYAGSADSILSEIGNQGAKAVAIELYDSSSWSAVMQKIEAGDPDWLLVALALSAGTDGAVTIDLSRSISQALLTNPERVLELFVTLSPPRLDLCQGWAEFAGHESFESAWAEVTAKIESLQRVTAPGLPMARDACLKKLRDSESELRQIYSMKPG